MYIYNCFILRGIIRGILFPSLLFIWNHIFDVFCSTNISVGAKRGICRMVICVSFSNEQVGGWSTDGIMQDEDNRIPVLCNSKHLTSFCVLVGSESTQVIVEFSYT